LFIFPPGFGGLSKQRGFDEKNAVVLIFSLFILASGDNFLKEKS
jgi:hypothetical protein